MIGGAMDIQEQAETLERAALMAYLQERESRSREWDGQENAVSRTYRAIAEAIQRGDHHRQIALPQEK